MRSNETHNDIPRRDGLVVNVFASHTVGRGFTSRSGHTKDHHRNGTKCLPVWCAVIWVGVQPDCLIGRVVCGTVHGDALKRSPGINRKSRVSYPGPGFLSSVAWPSMPKKNSN